MTCRGLRQVIAVEPESVDVMRRSLLSGHCVEIAEPGAEGIWVKKLGDEVRAMW